MVDLVTVPIGATTHAKAEVPGDFEELGALGGRLERMVCLKPAHSLAREGLDEVNDAIPCGMGNERMSAGLDDKAHRLDGIGIHDVDVARRCWPEQLGKRLIRVRDASTFDE